MKYWSDGSVNEVALIDPAGFAGALRRKRPARKPFPHTGLGYVAASLERNGDRVRVLDAGVATSREVQRFLSQPAHLFGIMAMCPTFREALQAARAVKARYPATPVLLGGSHVSIAPETCLGDPAVDYALRGEAEEIIIDFLEVLKRNTAPAPEVLARIPGLVYRLENRICVNPPTPRVRALDELPFPAWHLFPMDRYRQHALLTSRGCPQNCGFCTVEAIRGRLWIHRDPEQAVSEIDWLIRHWGLKLIHVNDDNFTTDPRHVQAFCDAILRRKLRVDWVAQGVRADALTPELLSKMRRAGCHRVSLGLESADPQVLDAVGKKTAPEDMARAVRLCQDAGIQVLGMFMVGNPGDTEETVLKSLKFAQELRVDLPVFNLALPYPRTRLWEYAERHGTFVNSDYTAFTPLSEEPVFFTPEFPLEARRRAFKQCRTFSRRQVRRYHLAFWWPSRLWRRNRYEIWNELKLLGRALWLPVKAVNRLLRPRGEAAA